MGWGWDGCARDHSILGKHVSEPGRERADSDPEYLSESVGCEHRGKRDLPALQFGHWILLLLLSLLHPRTVKPLFRSAVFVALCVGHGGHEQLPFDAAFAAAGDGARAPIPDELRVRQVH